MSTKRCYPFLILCLFLSFRTFAQDSSPLSHGYSFGLMAGVDSYDRWHLFFPSFLIADASSPSEGYSSVFEVDICVFKDISNYWRLTGGLSFQHSNTFKQNDNIWLYGGQFHQNYLAIPVSIEHCKYNLYFGAGMELAYEMYRSSTSHYPVGVVRASHFFLAPIVDIGWNFPLPNGKDLQIGFRTSCGILRYYNYNEQCDLMPEERHYNRYHAMPTMLLYSKLNFKTR